MSDPLKSGSPVPADALTGAERDARVEQLLLQGLDHYFGGEYDSAVHVWTRVLFLDRGHARARAYIERARSAQAERQRESEELLHRGVEAFDRGDTGDARQLFTAAVSQGAEPEVALSYLGRLDRLQATPPAAPPVREARPPARTPSRGLIAPPATPRRRRAQRSLRVTAALLVLIAAGTWAGVLLSEMPDLRASLQLDPVTPAPPPAPDEPLVVPRTSELALARARTQFGEGLAFEALKTLTAIGPDDPLEDAANRLRVEIQRVLLASGAPASRPSTLSTARLP